MKIWYKVHPGPWITLGILEIWFIYNLWSVRTTVLPIIVGSINFFIISMGFYIITVYHVRWLMKIDEKQQEKDKQNVYRESFTPVHPRLGERSWISTLWDRGHKTLRTTYEGFESPGRHR